MNIHHLELFYFVAKHGGIAAAVRNIPYGIQQPAVSGQIAKHEETLGTKLFQRRPFALSPTGTELFEFIRPFFDNIETVAERLRQNSSPQLRIAAPAIVLHDYLPQILQRVRAKFPAFRLYLHEATRTDAERLLLARDVDLAIMLLDKKSRAGMQVRQSLGCDLDPAKPFHTQPFKAALKIRVHRIAPRKTHQCFLDFVALPQLFSTRQLGFLVHQQNQRQLQ